jgi:hypothetical protein
MFGLLSAKNGVRKLTCGCVFHVQDCIMRCTFTAKRI